MFTDKTAEDKDSVRTALTSTLMTFLITLKMLSALNTVITCVMGFGNAVNIFVNDA